MSKFLLLCLLFCGCVGEFKVEEKDGKKFLSSGFGTTAIREFEYDGCTYVVFGIGDHITITHKGNCNNHQ